MNELLIGLVSALLATNQPLAVSNVVQQHAGVSIPMTDPNDPAELELQKLMADDDAAAAEVDKWIQDNNAFAAGGAAESRAELNKKIIARFDPIRKGYEDFLRRHPGSAPGYLAYGSFLNDTGDEEGALAQYEIAARLDPKNPAAWNNMANYHGEHGPLTNAFIEYAKAIELNPAEPVYYQNFATTVYLYRKDAREFFNLNEQQVFDKALALYRQAMKLDPQNFPLATDYAQSYYGIRPYRTNDALVAWTNTLQVARDETEREGVYLHLARLKIAFGRFDEARGLLAAVTNENLSAMQQRLERNLALNEHPPTNSAAVSTNAMIAPTNAP